VYAASGSAETPVSAMPWLERFQLAVPLRGVPAGFGLDRRADGYIHRRGQYAQQTITASVANAKIEGRLPDLGATPM